MMQQRIRFITMAIGCAMLSTLAITRTILGEEPLQAVHCDRAAVDSLKMEGLTIQSVEATAAGAFKPPRAAAPLTQAPGFCRIQAAVSSTPESLITFEVWIPENWNGKIVATGNGGYSNVLSYSDMAYALSQRYSAVGGDT